VAAFCKTHIAAIFHATAYHLNATFCHIPTGKSIAIAGFFLNCLFTSQIHLTKGETYE